MSGLDRRFNEALQMILCGFSRHPTRSLALQTDLSRRSDRIKALCVLAVLALSLECSLPIVDQSKCPGLQASNSGQINSQIIILASLAQTTM